MSNPPGDPGARAACVDADHFALKAAGEALREVYGTRPLAARGVRRELPLWILVLSALDFVV
jgi:hypothetical protein